MLPTGCAFASNGAGAFKEAERGAGSITCAARLNINCSCSSGCRCCCHQAMGCTWLHPLLLLLVLGVLCCCCCCWERPLAAMGLLLLEGASGMSSITCSKPTTRVCAGVHIHTVADVQGLQSEGGAPEAFLKALVRFSRGLSILNNPKGQEAGEVSLLRQMQRCGPTCACSAESCYSPGESTLITTQSTQKGPIHCNQEH